MASPWLEMLLFGGLESRLTAKLDKIQRSIDSLTLTDAQVARIKAATSELVEQQTELEAVTKAYKP